MVDMSVNEIPAAGVIPEVAMPMAPLAVAAAALAVHLATVNNSDKASIERVQVASKKEIIMADIVTGTVTGQLDNSALHQDHADIRRENAQSEAHVRRDVHATSSDARREAAEIGSDIRRETAKEASDVIDVVKTAGWANADRTGTEADRIVQQDTAYFIAGQQYAFQNAAATAALKASTDLQFASLLNSISTQGALGQAATALEGAKTAAAVALAGEKQAAAAALAQALIGQQIVQDGASTRALINELKMEQLNRELIERNSALVEARCDARHWQGGYNNSQFAAVTSQLNAFQSQLQEVRQGTVNFGTMSGNAGRNTSTNNIV